uniref:Uncharacterized protein n=1 Tax=Anguilla anguilla TaxID=7936 RepID=A0A0E9Q4H6_ANGAN
MMRSSTLSLCEFFRLLNLRHTSSSLPTALRRIFGTLSLPAERMEFQLWGRSLGI